MRRAVALLALPIAFLAAARAADAQPTAVPTASGAGAVTPSDQSAVRPALPDASANRNVELGTGAPTPAAWPPGTALAPPATPTPTPVPTMEPGHSEPNTGTSPASAGSVHRKPSVAGGRPVTVARAPLYTVLALEPGKSLTLRRADGSLVKLGLAKHADVPEGIGPGSSVSIQTKTQHGKKVVTRVRETDGTPVLTNVN